MSVFRSEILLQMLRLFKSLLMSATLDMAERNYQNNNIFFILA